MGTNQEINRNRRTMALVKAYPFGLLLIATILNVFMFGVTPPTIAAPSTGSTGALAIAAVLLVINPTWLMTTTELTRVRFDMYSTPEEWTAAGKSQQDAPEEGLRELERCHNAHRNTTENTVYFVLIVLVFAFVSPPAAVAQVWIVGFPVARLGYTYSYLAGKSNARGFFYESQPVARIWNGRLSRY
jgi:uncharacterized MAPEG superfamily protein